MSLRDNFRQPTYLGYLAIIRIFVGYHFITTGWQKISTNWGGSELTKQLMDNIQHDMFTWHHDFIVGWVVPNAGWFSHFIGYSELALGLSLLVGCLVRVSSAFGTFHMLNIYTSIATGAQVGLTRIFIVAQLMFLFASAGRSLGIDGWLHRRFPRSPIF